MKTWRIGIPPNEHCAFHCKALLCRGKSIHEIKKTITSQVPWKFPRIARTDSQACEVLHNCSVWQADHKSQG